MFKTVKVIDHARKEVLNETKRSNQIFLISKGGGGQNRSVKDFEDEEGGEKRRIGSSDVKFTANRLVTSVCNLTYLI